MCETAGVGRRKCGIEMKGKSFVSMRVTAVAEGNELRVITLVRISERSITYLSLTNANFWC